jgi:hypothetical protein
VAGLTMIFDGLIPLTELGRPEALLVDRTYAGWQ